MVLKLRKMIQNSAKAGGRKFYMKKLLSLGLVFLCCFTACGKKKEVIAKIGDESVILPDELETKLKDLIRHRISVLQIDDRHYIRKLG